MTPCTRLHVSPLNPQLLPTILPVPLLEKASNISFHTIETFPEKSYGFIDLPGADADKLKKKLNGSTLRGSKMRVETARPKKGSTEKMTHVTETPDEEILKSTKRRKKEEGVIPGHELQDRKVKRGWTDPTSSDVKPAKRRKGNEDKQAKSKVSSLTGEAECLFKTSLPPTATASGDSKEGKVRKKKKAGSKRDVLVQEFANTTKHATFLRDDTGIQGQKRAVAYTEGKGWLDEDGNVVEPESKSRQSKTKASAKAEDHEMETGKPRSRRSSRLEVPSVKMATSKTGTADDETSSSGTSSESEQEDRVAAARTTPPQKSQTSSRRQANGKLTASATEENGLDVNRGERLSITRSSATPPPFQDSAPTSAPAAKDIHPLDALFKHPHTAASRTPKKPDLEVQTSFSMEIDGEESTTQGLLIPQTPFTQQDIRQRRQRSAAPTPDTAAPGKTFGEMWEGNSDISDGGDEVEAEAVSGNKNHSATPDSNEEKTESEFSKWFWEHRGENNRAWKRRRREVGKEKKQKANKVSKVRKG